jgi:hypothetical protein
MHIVTRTTHVADQVAALEADSRRRRALLRPLLLVLGVLTAGAVLVLLVRGETRLAAAAGGAGLVLLLLAGVVAAAGPSESDMRTKRAGAAGEQVIPRLLEALPDSWTLINGVPLPGAHADVDHVLIGPGGVFAIEAKNHSGWVECAGGPRGDAWGYSRRGPNGTMVEAQIGNPSGQARWHARELAQALRARGVDVPIEPVVVFTHPRVELHTERPSVPVLPVNELLAFLDQQLHHLGQRETSRVVQAILSHE